MRRGVFIATLVLVTAAMLTSTGCEESAKPVPDTHTPTDVPTNTAIDTPTQTPINTSTHTPTNIPTHTPTSVPTHTPTNVPTLMPTNIPTPTATGTATISSVRVDLADTYRLESGAEVKAAPSSLPLSVEAQVVGAGGQSTIYPAQLSSDGTRYEIADVPEGPYWLVAEYEPTTTRFPVPNLRAYQRLTSRTVDWGTIYAGRPDIAAISSETIVSVEASGLPIPWQQYTYDEETDEVIQPNQDSISVYSYNADAYAAFVSPNPDDPHAPLDGATSFDGWSFDWSRSARQARGFGIVPAVDSSKGDVLLMTQLIQSFGMKAGADFDDPWAFYFLATAGPSCTVTPVTMQDGVAVTFSGAFVSNPTKTLALDFKGSKFADELMASVSTTLTSTEVYLGVDNEPGAPFPIIGQPATLVTASTVGGYRTVYPVCYPDGFGTCDADLCPEGCDPNVTEVLVLGDLAQSFEYQNPYSAHGQELLYGSVFFEVDVLHPVSQAVVGLRGSLVTMVPVTEGNGKPLEPLIGLPKNLKLADQTWPLDEPQSGLGSAFAITWEPPALGTAQSYLVRVRAWSHDDDPGVSFATSAVIATFRTSETSIDLPDGLLTAGEYYSVTVQADSTFVPESPNQYVSATIASGVVSSGLFSP